MNNDCQWIESKTESYFADSLSSDDRHRFETHLGSCTACAQTVESLKNVDTLVQGVFQHRVAIANRAAHANTRPRVLKIALGGVGLAAAAALLLSVGVTFLQQTPAPPTALQVPPAAPELQNEVKKDNALETSGKLTKPGVGTPARTGLDASLDANAPNAPDFAVTDAAGYTTTLETYKGQAFLFGVVGRDQKAAIAGLQQIFDALSTNRSIRIVGVSRTEESFDGITFPIFYNHGSKLLGVADGQFLLMDASGTKVLEGSLTNTGDIARVRSQVSSRGK